MTTLPPPRPVMRYHGGKYRLAPWIIAHFPPHKCYVEPFGGAASVLLHKSRAYAEVYNELDGEITNLFRVLREPSQSRELEKQLRLTPFARTEFSLSYERCDDPIEQARRTVVRSFMGFGSTVTGYWTTGFRNNTTRSGSTPAHDWANYPDALVYFTNRLSGVVIESKPAIEILRAFDSSETLFYCDPPYVSSTRNERWGKCAYRHEMSDDDHREFAATLRQLSGMVVLSGYACDLYDIELFPDWQRIERATMADGAEPRTEVLWLNAATTRQLHSSRNQLNLLEVAS